MVSYCKFSWYSPLSSATHDDVMSFDREVTASLSTIDIENEQQLPPQSPRVQRESVSCTSTSEQEQNPGEKPSDMVTSKPAIAAAQVNTTPTTPTLALIQFGSELISMLKQRDATVTRKKDKIEELKHRQTTVEGYLSGKDAKIQRMSKEAEEMESKLKEERKKKEAGEEDLRNKQKRIEQLEGYVYQKNMELQQEKDDKHETCQQLREQLKQAEEGISMAAQRILHLQEDADKTYREVEITHGEREKIITVLTWMRADLAEEQERQRKYTKCTILVLLSIIFILFAIVVEVVPQYCMN